MSSSHCVHVLTSPRLCLALFTLLLVSPPARSACPPRVTWENSFGGDAYEYVVEAVPTADGGFLLAGHSLSGVSGNKTSPNFGDWDVWLVRVDAGGTKLWERSYGGTGTEALFSADLTADGGFLLGVSSDSPPSGNKTSPNLGGSDVWVLKLSAQGDKQWERSVGGSLGDGGYVFADASLGCTIIGTSNNVWTARLDAGGNTVAEQSYSSLRNIALSAVARTDDGGFLLAGQATIDALGYADGWAGRLAANGDLIWQQRYGGSGLERFSRVVRAANGEFILGGATDSPPSGNKTSPTFGSSDGWIVIINGNGALQWEQTFGGHMQEDVTGLRATADGGFVFGGSSLSPISGNKTTPLLGNPAAWGRDWWVVRVGPQRSVVWQRAVGGSGDDEFRNLLLTADGGYLAVGNSNSTDADKASPAHDRSGDFWVVKLGAISEGPCDTDGDGVPDDRDQCPNTAPGGVVNANGCSLAQLCPCNGDWRDHGEYVRCVMRHAWEFFRAGRITLAQRREIIRQAMLSRCGRPGEDATAAASLEIAPTITNAIITAATTTIEGVLTNRPDVTYTLDFYGDMECAAVGLNEGEHHLGTTNVTTDAEGRASFDVRFITTSFWRRSFTVVATDSSGNMSEFSPCWTAPIPGQTFVVVNTNDTGLGSFRQAMLDSNTNTAPNHIVFNIPGPGPHIIRPGSGLYLDNDETTVIDGFTQPGASPNTLPDGNNAVWVIEFDGSLSGGLRLPRHSALRGLRIANCSTSGVNVRENSSIAGCFIYNNHSGGIDFDDDSYEVLIGGTAPADRNVISGNRGPGIVTDGSGLLRVLGNWIGTDLTGAGAFGNQGDGIFVQYLGGSWIGGLDSGEANVIAFNAGAGVKVYDWRARIRGNRIFANRSLGIDLLYWDGEDFVGGVSTNDPGDADLGGNQLQNFPLITNVVFTPAVTTIHGSLHSESNKTYALDFYANTTADSTGHGPGERHIGSVEVTTDADGNASFTATFNVPLRGHYLTATATNPDQNTSEFSPAWPQPLLLEFARRSGATHELTLRNADGSPISSERLAGLRILAARTLSSQAVWEPLPDTLELANGRARLTTLELTNSLRFFRAIEVP